jgi:bacterioferritin (cytochrome b1)
MSDQGMDVEAVVERLNRALPLQQRSALQYAIAAGGVLGLEYQALASELWRFAEQELADVRRLVEKVTALGGDPSTGVAAPRWSTDPREMVEWLIESESEVIETIQDVIPETGKDGPSEALEHLVEHMILRKQSQVDLLLRARRSGG